MPKTEQIFIVLSLALLSIITPITGEFPCLSNLKYDFRNIDRFTDNMCAQCLWFMAGSAAPWNNHTISSEWTIVYNHSESINALLCTPNCEKFSYNDLLNETHWIRLQLKSEFYINILLDCCEQARQCCSRIVQSTQQADNLQNGLCPAKWDGFACWNSSIPGLLNEQACPGMTFIASGLTPTTCRQETSSKQCLNNGTWHRIWNSRTIGNQTYHYDQEYTNYFQCSTPGATHKLRFNRVSAISYAISGLFVFTGLMILLKFGPKNRPVLLYIHVNFFISLILTCLCSILVLVLIKERHYRLDSMIDRNPLWCRVLICLRKAARLTNYCWMLNEGIFLWLMIVQPFKLWKKMMKFYFIGWGLPVLVMTIYTVIHSQEEYNTHCWSKTMGYWEFIYSVPPITFIVVNFCLLFHLTFVLLRKLRSSDHEIRSAVRASLFLIPVFGLQYLFYIVPFDPFESCSITLFCAHYAMLLTEALQGAMVACVFCFFNSEVQENIRKEWNRRHMRRGYRTSIVPKSSNDIRRQETAKLTRSSTSDESRVSSN